MSSQEDAKESINNQKKRRIERACDACRRKKVRCDGDQRLKRRCNNCIANNLECTYQETSKRQYSESYVRELESRLQEMEKLLEKFHCESDFVSKPDVAPSPDDSSKSLLSPPTLSRNPGASTPVFRSTLDVDDLYPSDDELAAQNSLEKSFRKLYLNVPPPKHAQYLGKSSGVTLLQTVVNLKQEFEGKKELGFEGQHEAPKSLRRPECWQPHPWISETFGYRKLNLSFPDEDLMPTLIDLYFQRYNTFFPLLHRPTFMQSISNDLHLQDPAFGFTVLLVCALASRYIDDPRVFLDTVDNQYSAGWKWFKQVQEVRKGMSLEHACLYDLQIACLSSLYLVGTSAPQAAWTLVGAGIRLAQDLGAHRRKMYGRTPTVQGELKKRAFWVLVILDRTMCSGLGRPCAIQDEDFDLELPIECDDEYWTNSDPELAWKQPEGKPSVISYFNSQIRLNQIHAFTLRTIYAINKSKALLGYVGPSWEQHIVAEIDSALNKWIDSIPDHLRWDPKKENMLFLNQSAALYARYYALQISVHRPFLPSPQKQSSLSFPSLAICTNAARSCIHVMDVLNSRTTSFYDRIQVIDISAVFMSAIVLLVNIWARKHITSNVNFAPEISDIHKAMAVFKSYEPRTPVAAIFWDVLRGLATFGSIPLPPDSLSTGKKRQREPDGTSVPLGTASEPVASPPAAEPRRMAGTHRVDSWQENPSRRIFTIPPTSNGFSNGVLGGYHNSGVGQTPVATGSSPSSIPPPTSPTSSWYSVDASSPPLGASTFSVPNFSFPSDFVMHSSDETFPLNPSLPAHLRTPEEAHAFSSLLHAHLQPDPTATVTQGSTPELLDYDALSIWSSAPTNFSGHGWETYASMIFNSGGILDNSETGYDGTGDGNRIL